MAARSRLATLVRSLFSALATSTLRIVGGADIALSAMAADNLADMPKKGVSPPYSGGRLTEGLAWNFFGSSGKLFWLVQDSSPEAANL